MKKLSSNEIRKMWVDFFQAKEHHFLAPVSLIPVEDPSLLWINSGVATLKPYFDGRKTPPSPRLTNSQKAIRTNDIENVGVTARHQTLFEMLGNFSIGDYFKKEAIEFGWELLTSKDWFDLDPEKLYITVFNEDEEAYKIWTQIIGIKPDHIFPGGRDTNFWDVGQGPCGPNTEIFYDRGVKWDPQNIGTKLLSEDIENDRYIEIWNIVFSQFNNDGNNNYTELPRKNIDTGAGLERIVSIFQDTPTNFETDIFLPTIKAIEKLTKHNFQYSIENYDHPNPKQTRINTAFKVIADHIRAISFAIADGVFPGNKDRGYIIRRLIRRSSIYGKELGINNAFLYQLVDEVIKSMGEFYPYLINKKPIIVETIKNEENKFLQTLSKGYELLEEMIQKEGKVSAANAMLLFESFGFPIEQTIELAQNSQVEVDLEGFNNLLNQAKDKARNARKDVQAWDKQNELFTKMNVQSNFTGWEELTHKNAKIIFMFVDEKEVEELTDTTGYLILDQTPFYAEKGGQAADHGIIQGLKGVGTVDDVQQGPQGQNIHRVTVEGTLSINDFVDASVDENKRVYTMKNHSGTHMVHSALRAVLGDLVMQSGSYNDEHGLRMDFTFNRNTTPEELHQTQALVNQKIKEAIKREVHFVSMQEAVEKHHALAFFAEKYDEIVRVVQFGNFSSELCGGTHVENTRDIEDFVITGIESKGSGLFRIKCLTSFVGVQNYYDEIWNEQLATAQINMDKYEQLKQIQSSPKIEKMFNEIKHFKMTRDNVQELKTLGQEFQLEVYLFEKQVALKNTNAKLSAYKNLKPSLNDQGFNQIKINANDLDMQELKILADELRNTFDDVIVILLSESNQGNFIVVAVSEKLQGQYPAIEVFKNMPGIKTKGGGNHNLAQGKFEK
ncbi:alanine--tRNA ligase [Williamsoniiplasma luminosum]|uniref:Alanine--tRNA ligase n=1 Tax=Williamsoniiplasma luminosum TaxID=214888 RepID=A0A2S0NKX4_9MOLU|nr:alanine--tRNA ligase [Williamsoniiplasma luminosum]AVP49658.1 MAG: alanine--tRNA ligase [Williamsoniiplasma luminosum]